MRFMMIKFSTAVALSLTMLASSVWADDYLELRQSLTRINPEIEALSIQATPMSGIYSVMLNSGDQIYMTEDGDFFFAGAMYQNSKDQPLVNLTEQGASETRLSAIQGPEAKQAWVYPATGEKKASITVFTDIDCYYCQKLHTQMEQYNAYGIEVRYLAYPRAGLASTSNQVLVDAWCAENPNEFLTIAKARSHDQQGPQPSPDYCDNPVATHYALGQALGVTGTPSIILEDGQMVPGFVPPKELASRLGLL